MKTMMVVKNEGGKYDEGDDNGDDNNFDDIDDGEVIIS